MKTIGKFIAWIGASLMMAGIFGFLAAALVFHHYSSDLPSFEKLAKYSPPVVTRLYAGDGRLLAEYAKEKRIFVPLSAIPARVKQAFLSAEDKNFYNHQGIDIFGIGRAVVENASRYGSGHSMAGGSTITQQVVKNFLLTNEKSLERKIKEAILAYRITKVYTKDKILELYLNQIYLGNGSYGVAAAALNYFNKPLNELTTEEAALLATMPKAPASYDPRRNYDAALRRRNYVIGRMLDDGYVEALEAQRALASPIIMEERAADEIARADFFAEEVRRSLAGMYGSSVLYEGGLTVKTTVNPELQVAADHALRDALIGYDRRYGYRGPVKHLTSTTNWEEGLPAATEKMQVPLYDGEQLAIVLKTDSGKATIGLPDGKEGTIALAELKWARKDLEGLRVGKEILKPSDALAVGDIIIAQPIKDQDGSFSLRQVPEVNGAMVVMDPHTGRVLAMSGGYSYSGSEFNRATQAKRQPGSAFKPFVYLTALENGLTPSTIIMDEPIELPQGPGLPMWRPQNYGGQFLGPTTMRVGLEKSRNTITVRLAQIVGLNRIVEVVRRLGVYKTDVPKNYSMVLGSHETTLLDMVTGYSMIANGGRKIGAALIERIDDRNGAIIFRRDNRECKGCEIELKDAAAVQSPPQIEDTRQLVIDPRVAYQMTSLMEGVVLRGTATGARKIGKPVAGKTGTTNDSRDVWFIGFSPDLVAGVYIGYDQPRSMGAKETGGKVAVPAFTEFMTTALKDEPATPFRIPPGIMMMQVDLHSGLPVNDAAPASGPVITEAFAVGGPIFRPKPPEDMTAKAKDKPEEEDAPADENTPTVKTGGDHAPDGFNPYAGWEDSNYYMSPEKAQLRDQQLRQQQLNNNNMDGGPDTRNRPMDNPANATYPPAPPPFNTYDEGDPMTDDGSQRARPAANPYQPAVPEVRRPGYNPGSAASQGTGGLY